MHFFQFLLLGFLLVPLLEIYLLIEVGSVIGAVPTVFLVVFTAVLGAFLLRHQGLNTLHRVRTALARGELPATAMLEGGVLLICGALLLTPGFFTDALGFLGLVPAIRRRLIHAFLRRATVSAFSQGGTEPRGPRTIEGEFKRDD